MKALIFGASAGLGRQVADVLASQGHTLLLVASDARDLDALAADLTYRYEANVVTCVCAVGREAAWLERMDACLSAFGLPDTLLFPIGASSDLDNGLLPYEKAAELIEVNFLAVAGTLARLLERMVERQTGVIVGIGSIAAARGRSRNVVYAAAKRALESYFESLRHLTAGRGIRVQFYCVGYLATGQAHGRALLLPPADPKRVAEAIVSGLGRGEGVYYIPRYWRWLLVALRITPWTIFRRLRF